MTDEHRGYRRFLFVVIVALVAIDAWSTFVVIAALGWQETNAYWAPFFNSGALWLIPFAALLRIGVFGLIVLVPMWVWRESHAERAWWWGTILTAIFVVTELVLLPQIVAAILATAGLL